MDKIYSRKKKKFLKKIIHATKPFPIIGSVGVQFSVFVSWLISLKRLLVVEDVFAFGLLAICASFWPRMVDSGGIPLGNPGICEGTTLVGDVFEFGLLAAP